MKNYNSLVGLSPELRAVLADAGNGGLPVIRGEWKIVDPYKLTSATGGIEGTFSNIRDAYGACTTAVGDGILVMSGGTTSAHTTSYLSVPLAWTKNGITVVGVAAPTRQFGRARIANIVHTTGSISTIAFASATTITDSASGFVTAGFAVGDICRVNATSATNDSTGQIVTAVTAGTLTFGASTFTPQEAGVCGATVVSSYCTQLVNVSGDNNAFYNIQFANFDADALAIGGVIVSGDRNYFGNCQVIGAGALPADRTATTSDYSLSLVGAQDNTFVDCTIGTDMTDRGNTASGDILFTVDAAKSCERNRFYGCEVQSYVSTGTAHGALKSSGATSCRRDHVFTDCIFRVDTTAQAVVLIGTAATEGKFYMINSFALNYGAWEGGSGNMTRISAPAAVAAGGGGLVVVGTET